LGGELGEGEPDARLNYSKRKTTDEEGDLNWMRVVLGEAETTPIRKKKEKNWDGVSKLLLIGRSWEDGGIMWSINMLEEVESYGNELAVRCVITSTTEMLKV
jgi:hypothetical protein